MTESLRETERKKEEVKEKQEKKKSGGKEYKEEGEVDGMGICLDGRGK